MLCPRGECCLVFGLFLHSTITITSTVCYWQIISICDNWQEFGWTEWISFLSNKCTITITFTGCYWQIIIICDNWQEFGWTEWNLTQKWNSLSPSKFLSVVTDANDLWIRYSEMKSTQSIQILVSCHRC
jgi:hypothetical protein